MLKYRLIRDIWNAYQYGDKIKVVYIKTAYRPKKTDDLLFPELEGLPQNLKKYAIECCINSPTGTIVDVQETPPTVRKEKSKKTPDERFSSSLARTKSTIFELALCNEFTYFCTFTQDEKKVNDRFDLKAFRKDLAQFIRNQNKGRKEPIKYLLIPERHKNGAWHLHGLFMGLEVGRDLRPFTLAEVLPYKIRNQLKNGENVYNWDKISQKYGFFTATEVKNHSAVSAYITKYVTKNVVNQALEEGRHLFFASQGLKRRETLIKDSTDYANELCKCPVEEWDFENDYCKIKWLSLSQITDSKI